MRRGIEIDRSRKLQVTGRKNMKTNSGKRRFWAAVLCVVAVLAMTVGGLDAPKMRSVYAKQQAGGT